MIKIISLYLAVLTTHLLLVYFGTLPGEFKVVGYVDLFLAVLFCGGLLLAAPGIKKGAENFSLRFMAMTTAQMLLMLGLILVFVFAKIGGSPKTMGFTAIILFVILLVIQSVYLIRKVNQK
ncbi:MAG: hypothetical protein K0R65_2318 [Crocinitomicaceae bacterium]|jgi:hypothetical protein|nr:hypothetical protein [Crocinitomicaceae bacterium]